MSSASAKQPTIDEQIRSIPRRWKTLVYDVGDAFFFDRQDTVDIARRYGISEATAYSALIEYRRRSRREWQH